VDKPTRNALTRQPVATRPRSHQGSAFNSVLARPRRITHFSKTPATTRLNSSSNVGTAAGHQGGCNPHVTTEGFDIGVCIDDHGTGNTAYSDVYVNSTLPPFRQGR
jgi:hypothetical protein